MTQEEAFIKQTVAINNIKAFCTMRGIQLRNLEASIGVTKGYFSRIKAEPRGIPFYKILMAADALGVSLEKLVDPYVVNTMEIERIERQIESLESKKAELLGKRDDNSFEPWGDTAT